MYVANLMTREVITVTPETEVPDAIKAMNRHQIRHLPVLDGQRLVGIVSDRDIKDYLPSKASTLDVFELNYMLAHVHVRQIMRRHVFTVTPETAIEEAAMKMHDNRIGALPVLADEKLAGIISDRDIYSVLIDVTGVRQGGHRLCLPLADKPGSIREAADIIRNHGFAVESILSSHYDTANGTRQVLIRTRGEGNFAALKQQLSQQYPEARFG